MPERVRPVYARRSVPAGWDLLIRVQPGAGKSECAGEREGRLRVRLTAPAVDNKANEALVAFVAGRLGLRSSRVRLASGSAGRAKRLFLDVEEEPDWSLLA